MSTAETEAAAVPPTEEKVEDTKADGTPAQADGEAEQPAASEEPKKEEETKAEGEPEAKKEEEVKENGAGAAGDNSSAENSAPEGAAPAAENPAPECDAKPEETPVEVNEADEIFAKVSAHDGAKKSLLQKHLTKDILEKIKARKTTMGGTLADCIRSGYENLDSGIGVYASDPEAYKVFSEMFDPLIKDYHKMPPKKSINHPAHNFGDLEKQDFENLDPEGQYIISSRIRVGRSVDGFAFPPVITDERRKELETQIVEALNSLEDELKGTYHPLTGMSEETQKQLVEDHFLFKDDDRFARSAGVYKNWPDARGIFFNEEKNFLVWVNEEDHIRIISMQKGGDIIAVYKRLVAGVKGMESKLKFARDSKLGFLTFCPTNLGTTLRASVHIKIPLLAATGKFQETCDKYNLQARGIHGEHTDSEGGVYDISNKRRLGLTELQAVTEMHTGVKELIRLEKELAWVPENVQDMFDHLSKAKTCKSLLKKYLTKEVFDSLKEKKTSKEGTLGDCIISGVLHLDGNVGTYASDPEAFTEFAALFDPIIKDYHKLKATDAITHPATEFGDLENLDIGDLDPEGEMILSTRVRVGRSHKDFAFPPVLSKEDRVAMEQKSVEALNALEGELKGTYHPLTGMTKETQDQMTADHFLFKDNDRFLKAAGGYKDWPEGRGIFFSEDKHFLVWVNEEDHLRIISMQKGGDLGAVYKRLATAIKSMEEKLTFARDDRLGYLSFCPTNLGTSMRASVHVKIPHLSARKDFKTVCDKLKLQARGIHGEHTASEGGVFDISNKRRLGLTEIDAVKEMAAGVKEIIRLEKEAAAGKTKSCTLL